MWWGKGAGKLTKGHTCSLVHWCSSLELSLHQTTSWLQWTEIDSDLSWRQAVDREADSGKLLQRSDRKRHKVAWCITTQDRKALQQVIKSFHNITGTIYRASVTSMKWNICTEPKTPAKRAEDQIRRYRTEKPAGLNENPLTWWRSNERDYPLLARQGPVLHKRGCFHLRVILSLQKGAA